MRLPRIKMLADFDRFSFCIQMPLNDGDAESFRYELARILASRTFSKAAKQRELLRRLVEYALSSGKPVLSQYAIATDALGYPSTFDPASGGARIAMRRLRKKLAEYYANEGRLNRFRIAIEKQQYEPRLVSAANALPASALETPVIAPPTPKLAVLVLPFLPIGFRDDGFFCAKLTLGLMRALAASGQARVVAWTSHWIVRKTGDKREYHRATGADVILEGLVQEISGNRFKVGVHWIDGLTGLFDTFMRSPARLETVWPWFTISQSRSATGSTSLTTNGIKSEWLCGNRPTQRRLHIT